MIPTIQLRREEKQDLYGQILIYYWFYINCRSVREPDIHGTFSMREFLIDAIITFTLILFAVSILMIPFFLLGMINF